MIGQASLDDLNEKLPADAKKCTMDQFRPNFVVTGCAPFEEVSSYNYLNRSRVPCVQSEVGASGTGSGVSQCPILKHLKNGIYGICL